MQLFELNGLFTEDICQAPRSALNSETRQTW